MENTLESYIGLWLAIDKAYEKLKGERRRFCIHNLLRELYPTDEDIPRNADQTVRPRYLFVWKVCIITQKGGYEELGEPFRSRKKSRQLVHAIAMVAMNVGVQGASMRLIDQAYGKAKRTAALRALDRLEQLLG